MIRAALALSLMAGPVLAEAPAAFDEAQGFTVLGSHGEGVLVRSSETAYRCDLSPTEAGLVLADCLPILGPAQAAALADRQAEAQADAVLAELRAVVAEAPRDEDRFLGVLRSYALYRVKRHVAAELQGYPECTLVLDSHEADTAFGLSVMARITADLGYEGTLSDEGQQEVKTFQVSEATREMAEAGAIVIEQSGDVSARLSDCQ
jgi:hypothetical protein